MEETTLYIRTEDKQSAYHFSAKRYQELDGSITLSADELDLVVNGVNEAEAKKVVAIELREIKCHAGKNKKETALSDRGF